MGLQKLCNVLNRQETKVASEVIKHNAMSQFAWMYKQYINLQKEDLLWGEETEYLLVKVEEKRQVVTAALSASAVLKSLTEQRECGHWMPEMTEYQIESIPIEPYSGRLEDLILVEDNMRQRRGLLCLSLGGGVHALTFPHLPRCGCPGFTDPYLRARFEGDIPSHFLPAEVTTTFNPRPRAMEGNLMARGGIDYAINIPVFQDTHTQSPWVDGICWPRGKPDHVYLDRYSLGMSSSSMHVTVQALHLEDGRNMYDQFAVIVPIMMAMTAGSPVQRGFLTTIDSRWPGIEQACDDRTAEERQPQHCPNGTTRYYYSRALSPPWLLSKAGGEYNDVQAVYNGSFYDDLINDGVDEQMAMHVAIMMTRDAIVAYEDYAEPRAEDETEDYDNMNSVIWPTVRLKLPSSDGSIGWRVEFRPMGIHLTDFENASFAIFIFLFTRILREYDLSFLVPVSKIHENIDRAVRHDAVISEAFFFRCSSGRHRFDVTQSTYMSVDEIINGKVGSFTGIIPIMQRYLDQHLQDTSIRQKLDENLELVSRTASGQRLTQARWIREFVLSHPEYKQDSVVTERIQYDLITKCLEKTRNFEELQHI